MGRYSPNFGPSEPPPRDNALGLALQNIANAYLSKKMSAQAEERQSALDTADLYQRGFRSPEDAGRGQPPVEGRPIPTFAPPSFEPNGLPGVSGQGGGIDPTRGPGGIGIMREDFHLPDPAHNPAVENALGMSSYFDRVDQRDADLARRPRISLHGQEFVYSPEAVAAERSAGSDHERAAMLHAIDMMRASGELTGPDLTRAKLAANGVNLPVRSGLTYEQMLNLEAVRSGNRLEEIGARGDEARETRTTPPAGGASAPRQTPRDTFLNQRYQNYLNEKDAYGSHVYTNAEALAKATEDADLRYGATPRAATTDTSRASRLRRRLQ